MTVTSERIQETFLNGAVFDVLPNRLFYKKDITHKHKLDAREMGRV